MSHQQMIINYAPGEECRVAIVEDGRLEEFHTERAGAVSFVGNIYVGRVMNVEASIQAAFVDFGLESNGFLHVSDLHPKYFPGAEGDTAEDIGRKTPRRERPPIQQCLRRGQEVLVQVLKEGISTKGPTLTSYLSIPGRYLVMLPDMDKVGVSRKVEDDDQRREMKKVLDQLELPEGFGFIMRTAGEGRLKTDLKRDLAYLLRLWKDIERRRKMGDKPRLLYAESDLLMRALRDIWTTDISEIIIDNEAALTRAARFMKIVAPRSGTKLLHYNRTTPVFHAFGIEEQILRTHAREVPLPSGGSLVIDETEALVAIDVNSGKMRHHGDSETTAYRTNIEAVDEICRQLRLRDVGGLVMCDLIDMISRTHRRDIENRFKERLKRDRAASKTLQISQFGIVEMTRQRQKGSLKSAHYAKCPSCSGRGSLKRPDSVADDAMRDLAAILEQDKIQKVELVVSPRVAGELLSAKRQHLGRLESELRKHVDVRVSEDIPMDRVSIYAYDASGADVDLDRLARPKPPRDLPVWADLSGGTEEWAIDSGREEAPPLEAAPPIHDPLASPDDLFLSDDLDDVPIGAPEADGAATDGKRRRRRRGGRGRGGSGDANGGAPRGPMPAPARAAPAPAAPSRGTPIHADAPHGEGEAGEDDGTGVKRRRRRRRGGRGRGKSIDRAGVPNGNGVAPGAPMPVEADEPEMEGAPSSSSSSRGDSWDLPAAMVKPVTPSRAPRAQPVREEVVDEDDDGSSLPSARDLVADDDATSLIRAMDHMANSPPPDLDDDSDDAEGDEGEHQGAVPADGGSGEGGVKRRRRRRRGRGRGGRTADGAAPVNGGAPNGGAPNGGGNNGGNGGGGQGRGGPSAPPPRSPRPEMAPKPPASKPVVTKPVVTKPAPVKPVVPTKPAPTPPPGIKAPARSLFGTRRRLSPGEVKSVKRED